MDSRLLKDHIKSKISGDVDHVEEISGAGLALNAVELAVLMLIIVAACVKSYSALQHSRAGAHPAIPAIGVSNAAPPFGASAPNSASNAASPSIGIMASPIASSVSPSNAVMPNSNSSSSPPGAAPVVGAAPVAGAAPVLGAALNNSAMVHR